LSRGLVDSSFGTPDLIAEAFIKGRMYHVDGLILNNELIINQPSAYFNTCIEFQKGTHVGSYMLDDSNPLTQRLKNLNRRVLAILPSPSNFAFHAEYFHDENDELIFCEIASRPGGGAIKDAIYAKFKINIVTEWMKCEIKRNYQKAEKRELANTLTGFLLIPPSNGILKYVPPTIPFEWVQQYRVTASIDTEYKAHVRTSGEIVNIVVASLNESELLDRLHTVSTWMHEQVRWA
jgi:hypothetical protein